MLLMAAGYSATAANHRRQSPAWNPSPDESKMDLRSPHLPIDSRISAVDSNSRSNDNADGFSSRQVNPPLDNNQPTSGQPHTQFTAIGSSNNIVASRFLLWPPEYLARQVSLLHLKRQASLDSKTVVSLTPESLPVSIEQTTAQSKVQQRDKIKLMELRIINLVEQSVRNESDGLKLAREAVLCFESLKSVLSNLQAVEEASIPLANGPRVFDLSLMAQCNLAARLADQPDREAKLEAVEIYTELCRLASQSASTQSAALIQLTGGQSAPHKEARFLINRLGLNLGNLYSELDDKQKALRHYRLTLDRFSTLEGYHQLRLKLMHNISVIMMQSRQQQVVGSLERLLADNQMPATSKKPEGKKSLTPINASHHLFGLNLALCHYQQSDLHSMLNVLRDLSRVDICRHFVSTSHQVKPVASLAINDSHVSVERVTAKGVFRKQRDDKLHDFQQVVVFKDEVGGLIQDKLDRLIGRKRDEIAHCLLTVCNLMMELDDDETIETSSAFHFCSRILMESEHYSHLVSDLKMNQLSQLIEQPRCRARLNEAIERLWDICCHQLMATQHAAQPTSNQPIKRPPSSTIIIGHREQINSSRLSNMVANNASLFYRLQGQRDKAFELAELALANQESCIACLNLANCHFDRDDYVTAEQLYQRALSIDPTCWQANYNLLLASRKLKRTLSELPFLVRKRLSKDCHRQPMATKTVYHHKHYGGRPGKANILSTIQMALILQQSGQYKQSISMLSDLISSSKQAPEVHLLTSKLLDESGQQVKPLVLDILQQANREYPYYMPTLERIIALHIKDFNYAEAKPLLLDCIKNRPDQVRWYRMLAECHRGTTEYGKAIITYKAAIEDFPRDVTCLKAMIKLAEELGLAEDQKLYQAKLDRVTSEQIGLTTAVATM